jgi:hypothetical protein
MDILATAAVSGAVCFAAGVVFSRYTISEAIAIKEHVSAEVAEVRADITSLLEKAAPKL